MIYYEFIDSLYKLLKSRDNELLNRIMNADITLYSDMRFRFSIQIINFITKMVDKIYDQKLQELFGKLYNVDEFSIIIMDLRKELDYVNNFTKIKSIPSECLEDIINVYDSLCSKYDKFIIDNLNDLYGEEYSSIYEEIINEKEG